MLKRIREALFEAYTWVAVIAVMLLFLGAGFGVVWLFSTARTDEKLATWMGLLLTSGGICVALYQLVISRSQLDLAKAQDGIMRQQNDIILRRADLHIYDEHDTTGINDRDFPAGRPQYMASMSRRFYVSNTGTRGAHGFTLTVRSNELLLLPASSAWKARADGQRTFFIYNTDKPVYPNSLVDVPVLTVFKTNNSAGPMLNEIDAQVAYDDGVSSWGRPAPIASFSYSENQSQISESVTELV